MPIPTDRPIEKSPFPKYATQNGLVDRHRGELTEEELDEATERAQAAADERYQAMRENEE